MGASDDFEESDSVLDARAYAEQIIRDSAWKWDWDQLAEGHPSGEILTQEGCNKVARALDAARISIDWSSEFDG